MIQEDAPGDRSVAAREIVDLRASGFGMLPVEQSGLKRVESGAIDGADPGSHPGLELGVGGPVVAEVRERLLAVQS